MEEEKGKMNAEERAAVAVKIVAILEKEAGGHLFDTLHTVASLLDTDIKVTSTLRP